MNYLKARPRIGLALGSGGARGLAHIGVIKTLEKHDIPIDVIAGCSIGSMVGGFYASGMSTEEIENISLSTQGRRVFAILAEPHLKQKITGKEKVSDFIESCLGNKTFVDCRIPFVAIATNLMTGESVALTKGKLSSAIRASIAVPIAFRPMTIDDQLLADGGLSTPVPAMIAKELGADIVIAVNLDSYNHIEKWKSNAVDVGHYSLKIMSSHLAKLNCSIADVVINIDAGDIPWFEFTNGQKKIKAGEIATKELLPQLKKLIKNFE